MTDDEKVFLAQVALGLFSVEPDGTIWRLARWTGGGQVSGLIYMRKRRAERSTAGPNSYLRVMFKDGERRRKVSAHRIVWMIANRRPIPEGMEINHLDGAKRNNRPSNLEVVSHRQNAQHCHTMLSPKKKDQRGEKNSSAVLTDQLVIEMRAIWDARAMTQREIAIRFGVKQQTVQNAVNRKTWKHLP
jgi:predicted XRE-type DNA-binding protein